MNRPAGVTRIIPVKNLRTLKGSPTIASCYRQSKTILYDIDRFKALPKDQCDFIIGHEAGHINLNTSNEYAADDFATDWCVSQGNSLRQTLYAMTKQLNFPDNNPDLKKEQENRVLRQYNRLLKYDYQVNKNQKAKPMCIENNSPLVEHFRREKEESFLGLGKAAKAKKLAKAEKIRDVGQAKLINAQAKLELAKQGIASGIGGIGQGLANMGKSEPGGEPEPEKSNTMMYSIIAAVAVLILVAIAVMKGKRAASIT